MSHTHFNDAWQCPFIIHLVNAKTVGNVCACVCARMCESNWRAVDDFESINMYCGSHSIEQNNKKPFSFSIFICIHTIKTQDDLWLNFIFTSVAIHSCHTWVWCVWNTKLPIKFICYASTLFVCRWSGSHQISTASHTNNKNQNDNSPNMLGFSVRSNFAFAYRLMALRSNCKLSCQLKYGEWFINVYVRCIPALHIIVSVIRNLLIRSRFRTDN